MIVNIRQLKNVKNGFEPLYVFFCCKADRISHAPTPPLENVPTLKYWWRIFVIRIPLCILYFLGERNLESLNIKWNVNFPNINKTYTYLKFFYFLCILSLKELRTTRKGTFLVWRRRSPVDMYISYFDHDRLAHHQPSVLWSNQQVQYNRKEIKKLKKKDD